MLVALLWGAFALNYADRQLPFSIFPALQRDLGFSGSQLGLIGSIFLWIYAMSMPIAGRMADLFRRDRMILSSILLWSLATICSGLAVSVPTFLACRAFIGVTEALYYPAAAGLIAQFHSAANRSKALGLHQTAQFAGLAAGGWYGGYTADNFSWRMGFIFAGIAGILYAVLLGFKVPHREVPLPPAGKTGWRTMLDPFRSFCFVALSVSFFAHCAMLWVFYAWYPSFLYERYHLTMTESGWNATLFVQVSCALGVFLGAALADRLTAKVAAARFYVMAVGILLSTPMGYLTFATHELNTARLCSAFYGLFAGFIAANAFSAAFDVVAAHNHSFAAGALNATENTTTPWAFIALHNASACSVDDLPW